MSEQLENCPGCETPRPRNPNEGCPGCGRKGAAARVGSVLAGKYRLDSVLGEGGMGIVYRATHLALGGQVAVKFLLADWAVRADLRERFRREAAALTRLKHPGIVTAFDFGEDSGELFLVMELVSGTPLAKHVRVGNETMHPTRIVNALDQVLQVLEVAHGMNMVHRDLKPDNIMLLETADRVERIKVLDFGLVLLSDGENAQRLTATHAAQGTPLYMSPEQCRGRDVGPPTDIYALGVILFELLAGDLPFNADSIAQLFVSHMYMDPPAIRDVGLRREPPRGFEELARRAMSKRPEERPTAAQFRDELQAVLRGEDDASRMAHAAESRAAAVGLSREDRALVPLAPQVSHPTVRFDSGVAIGPVGAATAATVVGVTTAVGYGAAPDTRVRVALVGFDDAEASSLKTSLAVFGMSGVVLAEDALVGAEPVTAVLIPGDAVAVARTERLRAAGPPVLVLGVSRAEDVPVLVRAGASDVIVGAIVADAVAKKITRLGRRKR